MPRNASGPRALSSREPEEYQRATDEARAVRAAVAEQVRQQIVDSDITGSEGMLVVRLQELSAAKRTGDPHLYRAAVMELTAAGGALLAAVDLGQKQARPAAA